MGLQQSNQSKYTDDEFSSPEAKQKKITQSILSSNPSFSSPNTRSISDIVAFHEPGYFEIQELKVIQKYCKKLKAFVESQKFYKQEHLDEICQMESLEELKVKFIDEVEVMDAIRQFTQLKNLRSLGVDDSRLTYDGLVELVGLFPDLESLSIKIANIKFPETMLSMLQGMKNLRELTLKRSMCVQKQLLESIVKSAPGLTKLVFTNCDYQDSRIWRVLENLVSLQFLSLDVFSKSSSSQLFEDLPHIPSLQHFDSRVISKAIKTKNLHTLAQKYPNLKEAGFGQVPKINNGFVQKITELWQDLTAVDLSNQDKNQKITSAGIDILAESYPNLHSLNLSNCFKIGDKSLITISSLQKLKDLKLNFCELSTRGLIYLGKLKKLERLAVCFNLPTSTISLKFLKSLKLTTNFHIKSTQHKQQITLGKQQKENCYEISYGECLV